MSSASLILFDFLLNAVWQIPLIVCVAYFAARLTRRNGPQWEHRIWVGALLVELLLPFGQLNLRPAAAFLLSIFKPASPSAAGGSVGTFTGTAVTASPGWQLPPALIACALIAWAGAILYFTGRLVWRLHKTSALRRHAHAIAPRDYPVLDTFVSAHPVSQLLVANSVSSPAIIGFLRPALLLPPNFLDRTATNDVEAAIAHEMAHLRRHDYAKNLLYEILTIPIAWHPVAWLTRSRIAESREIVCDHIAAHSALGPQDYARALLRLASHQSSRRPQTIHAIGIFDSQSLERRVMQLTQSHIRNSLPRRLLTLAACAVLAVATGASALALHVEASAASGHSTHASSRPVPVGPGVVAGNRISGQAPKYPAEAKKKHIQGTVVIKAIISKQGKIESAHAISGPELLRESAVKAVRTWRYKPFMLNGRPVAVKTEIDVVYSLGNNKGKHRTTAMLHSPGIRKQMEEAQRAELNSARLQRKLAQAQKSVAAAERHINSPAFRKQIERAARAARQMDTAKIQKQIKEAQLKARHSARVQQQLAQARKQMAADKARLDSRKFKQQIAEAEQQAVKAQRQLKNSKIQKQMAEAQHKLQRALDALKKQEQKWNTTGSHQP